MEFPHILRAVIVNGDRAFFSEVMQMITSAVRKLLIAKKS